MSNEGKTIELEKLLSQALSDVAKEYRTILADYKREFNSRIEMAATLKNLKSVNVMHLYEAGEQAILQNFENNKKNVYDSMKEDFENQLQHLKEEYIQAKIDNLIFEERNAKRSQPKAATVLKEDEILEDWVAIKKSVLLSKLNENANP